MLLVYPMDFVKLCSLNSKLFTGRNYFGCSLLFEVDLSQSEEDSEGVGSDVSVLGLLNEI